MTEKELNQLYYLKIEIKRLKTEIEELENCLYRSPRVTDLPTGSGNGDPVGTLAAELSERKMLLELAYAKAKTERERMERFILSVNDAEMRLIIRLRHIDCMTWEEIGEKVHMHRTTVKRKYFKFLKVAHNAH